MKTTTPLALGTIFCLGLAACAPPPPAPTPIFPHPSYDKLGDNPQCEEGRRPAYVGSTQQDLRCVPDTEICEDQRIPGSNYPEWCRWPSDQPGGSDGGGGYNVPGRQPTSPNDVSRL